MLPKCPFFNCECLRYKCSAFEKRDRLGPVEMLDDGPGQKIVEHQPYCNTLSLYLPEGDSDASN